MAVVPSSGCGAGDLAWPRASFRAEFPPPPLPSTRLWVEGPGLNHYKPLNPKP